MGIDYNKRPKATPPAPADPPPVPAPSGPINTTKAARAAPPAPPAPAPAPPAPAPAPAPPAPPAPSGMPGISPVPPAPPVPAAPAASARQMPGSAPAPAPQAAPAPPPAPPAAPAPSAGPISLTKRGQSVSLTKGGSGPVRVNLNWNQAAPATGGGLFRKIAQANQIDLDLGCLFELADGRKGVVQALGDSFGALEQPPFVKLDKDDRSGAATDGENLFISAEHSAQIKRIAVFAFIYEGAKNWSTAGGVVTVHPPGGAPVTIALDETRDGVGMCAVCIIHGGPNGYTVERQVEYLTGHKQLDERFGWGMNWVRGSK